MLWLALVGVLILLGYAGSKPTGEPLYHWGFVAAGFVQDAILLGLVLLIARPYWDLLALHRPRDLGRTLGLLVALLVAVYVAEGIYASAVHLHNEQDLTPSRWEPQHAAAYVANGLVICVWVPFVEELTYRGLGFSLLVRFGRWPAIIAVGVLFGLSHGLLLSLPILAGFGCVLAWIRARTGSVVPGMVLHGAFNLVALVYAVVH